MDRAVGTAVVAAVLHLEEGARAVAARKGGEERRELLRVAVVNPRPALSGQLGHTFEQIAFVVVAQHDVHAFDRGDLLRSELRVAARHGNDRLRVAAVEPADQIAAFLVGVLRHGAAVDDAYVGLGRRGHTHEAAALELPGQSGGLREVELAAERMETDSSGLHTIAVFPGTKIRIMSERRPHFGEKA